MYIHINRRRFDDVDKSNASEEGKKLWEKNKSIYFLLWTTTQWSTLLFFTLTFK